MLNRRERTPMRMPLLKAFRYRLNPTKAQEAVLEGQLRLCRNLYNCALQERRDAYKKAGKTVTGYDQMKYLTEIKAALPEGCISGFRGEGE